MRWVLPLIAIVLLGCGGDEEPIAAPEATPRTIMAMLLDTTVAVKPNTAKTFAWNLSRGGTLDVAVQASPDVDVSLARDTGRLLRIDYDVLDLSYEIEVSPGAHELHVGNLFGAKTATVHVRLTLAYTVWEGGPIIGTEVEKGWRLHNL
jgi:hypothetical protein